MKIANITQDVIDDAALIAQSGDSNPLIKAGTFNQRMFEIVIDKINELVDTVNSMEES